MPAHNQEVRVKLEQTAHRSRHGVILRSEAQAAGLTLAQIDSRVRQQQWIPGPARGTLIMASQANNPLAQLTAATIGHSAIAWGHSALALWSLAAHPSKPTIALERDLQNKRVLSHVVAGLETLPRTNRQGIASASLELGLASMAGLKGQAELHEIIDECLRKQLSTWDRIEGVFSRFAKQGRAGSTGISQIVDERSADRSIPLSKWSRDFATKLMRSGLPRPRMEWRVHDERGAFLAQVDLAYPGQRYAIELDSVKYHLGREAFEVDRRRDADLSRQGWNVGRFTWTQFTGQWDWVTSVIASNLEIDRL